MNIQQISLASIELTDDDGTVHYFTPCKIECEILPNDRFRIYFENDRIIEGVKGNVEFYGVPVEGTDYYIMDAIQKMFSQTYTNYTIAVVADTIANLNSTINDLKTTVSTRNVNVNYIVPNGAYFATSISYLDTEGLA